LRERSGLSVRDLCARLRQDHGVEAHEDHIRNIETGARNAGPRLIYTIASVLQVPVLALLQAAPVVDPPRLSKVPA
jgi:transcriptional regulator with XRE-family HTH domain